MQGGNKAALRAMLGQPVTQTFAYGTTTEFLKWSKGIPTIVQAGDLAAGDYVTVNVRAPRNSDLAAIEQQPAGIVGDHGTHAQHARQAAVPVPRHAHRRSARRASRCTSPAATAARFAC